MNKFLQRAVEAALMSRCQYRHGCVVVSRGQVVSVATNRRVGDPDEAWRRAHVHAEAAALLAAGDKAYGSTLYVARVSKSGKPLTSRPCKKCERVIGKFKVAAVVWT